MHKISEGSYQQMISLMEGLMSLSIPFKRRLKSLLLEHIYSAGSRILNSRERQNIVWLCLEGLAREIFVNHITYKEKTTWFWGENQFLYTIPGFFDQQPTECAIELVTDCRMVLISYDDFVALRDEFKEAGMLSEKIRGAYEKTRREFADELHELTASQRYIKHKKETTELLKNVKQKQVAEYLGMSSDTLGRLRKLY